jgi:hypothetical protein
MTFSILPEPLQQSIEHFAQHQVFTQNQTQFPAIMHFMAKYKVPWILKWHYEVKDHILSRHFSVKWWDKFKHDRIISQVNEEFQERPSQLPVLPVTRPSSQIQSQPAAQTPSPQRPLVVQSPTSSHSSKSKGKSKANSSKSAELKALANQLLEQAVRLSNDNDEEDDVHSTSSDSSSHTAPPSGNSRWADYPNEAEGEYFQDSQNPYSP